MAGFRGKQDSLPCPHLLVGTHAWKEDNFFKTTYASHAASKPQSFACLAQCQLTAQLEINAHSIPLATCHFWIVSAVESLFNLFLKCSGPTIILLFNHSRTSYFFDSTKARVQFLMNSLIQVNFNCFSLN